MNFKDFISFVETWRLERDNNLPRCKLFCLLFNNNERWSIAIKSLLIKNSTKYISVYYLQEKLDFIEKNPSQPYKFLDYEGLRLYTELLKLD